MARRLATIDTKLLLRSRSPSLPKNRSEKRSAPRPGSATPATGAALPTGWILLGRVSGDGSRGKFTTGPAGYGAALTTSEVAEAGDPLRLRARNNRRVIGQDRVAIECALRPCRRPLIVVLPPLTPQNQF